MGTVLLGAYHHSTPTTTKFTDRWRDQRFFAWASPNGGGTWQERHTKPRDQWAQCPANHNAWCLTPLKHTNIYLFTIIESFEIKKTFLIFMRNFNLHSVISYFLLTYNQCTYCAKTFTWFYYEVITESIMSQIWKFFIVAILCDLFSEIFL